MMFQTLEGMNSSQIERITKAKEEMIELFKQTSKDNTIAFDL